MSIELIDLFPANWRATVNLTSTWSTDVTTARSLGEERRALVDRPYRTMEVLLSGLSRDEMARLTLMLQRAQSTRLRVPLYCDASKVTASSSGTTLYCDTRHRRFFVGGNVIVHGWSDRKPVDAQVRVVLRVYDDRLELTTALTGTVLKNSRVFPAIDGELSLEGAMKLVSDQVGEVNFSVTEVVGESALPTTCEAIPLGMDVFDDHPIFDLPVNFKGEIDVGYVRAGRAYGMGKGRVVFGLGDRGQYRATLPLTGLQREDSFAIVQLFDALRGRQKPFFLVAPETIFSLSALATGHVDVLPVGDVTQLSEVVTHLAVVMKDGTKYVRDVSSIVDNTTTFRVNLGTSLPALSALDVRRVTVARLMRMEDESIVEQWDTDGVCSVELPLVEVLEEVDSTLDVTEASVLPAGPSDVADLHYWLDASTGTWNDDTPVAPFTAERLCQPDPDVASKVHVWKDVRGDGYPFARANSSGHVVSTLTAGDGAASRRTIEHAHTGAQYFEIIDDDKVPWDNSQGWTLFVCLRTSGAPTSTYHFYTVQDGTSAIMFDWLKDTVKVYQAAGVVDSNLWINGLPDAHDGDVHVLVFTWSPGAYTRVYYDGVLKGSANTPAAYMPSDVTGSHQLNSLVNGPTSPGTVLREQGIPDHWFEFSTISYKRALSSAEINSVGQYLSSLYGTPWSDLP